MKKMFLWIVIIIVIAGIVVGAIMWNKPHAKAEDATGIKITATDLSKAYAADEHKADSFYLSKEADKKALEVTGVIAKVEKDQDGGTMIILDSGDPMTGVQCAMREKAIQAAQGKTVTIKGFCSGSGITGVTLTDCILK